MNNASQLTPLKTWPACVAMILAAAGAAPAELSPKVHALFEKHCYDCHDATEKKGGLDLDALKTNFADAENFARWVKVHDRIESGEMPPKKKARPPAAESAAFLSTLGNDLAAADAARQQRDGRSHLRRLNRVEFENTLRDLLEVPGLKVKASLPEDGRSHGFDTLSAALDLSHVHMEKYLAAVDTALNAALCSFENKPPVFKNHYRPWEKTRHGGRECDGWVWLAAKEKTAIGLVGMEQDPTFAPSGHFSINDDEPKATAVGLFRHTDPDFPTSLTLRPVLTGWHKLRVSGYSFGWDGKKVVPTDRHGAFSWGIRRTGEALGTVGVPANQPGESEITVWLERGSNNDSISIIGASLEKIRYLPQWNAQGIALEWVEIEGPFHDQWPPASHHALFGDLPVKAWTKESGVPKPVQQEWPRGDDSKEFVGNIYGERNEKQPAVYVESLNPAEDAEKLLRPFLRRAFRRLPTDVEVAGYTSVVRQRLANGTPFQDAMLSAYRAVLTSPMFLFLREPAGRLDDYALASRLSYFLWSSTPDAELSALADAGKLHEPEVLRAQTNRMLNHPKGARFTENFLGQWLNLREIAATQPDGKLYPEFMPWMQESMLLEARSYFQEVLRGDLGVTHFIQSDFGMLNEPLARLYGIKGVHGWDMRRVALPPDSRRGGFLTMGGILKTTANGSTTSPVKRGVFVMEKLLGIVPTPPPPDIGSIEPDVRGTTTIREQLEKHSSNASCAACHLKMDGYGFALESFDVTGEWRDHYRAYVSDKEDRTRKIVHGSHIKYIPGPPVECAGVVPDGRPFKDVDELRALLAADPAALARAFTGHLVTYATGAAISFSDRAKVENILQRAKAKNYGVRSLLHEVVQSEIFQNK